MILVHIYMLVLVPVNITDCPQYCTACEACHDEECSEETICISCPAGYYITPAGICAGKNFPILWATSLPFYLAPFILTISKRTGSIHSTVFENGGPSCTVLHQVSDIAFPVEFLWVCTIAFLFTFLLLWALH